uniref:Serine-rich protein-like protein n=2 Tax=Opuntia streptacantha TaxID=393608 RepID=A0A7C9EUX6_OPUST
MPISSNTKRSSGPVLRSLSPSGRFYGGSSTASSASAFASSTSSSFTAGFVHRSASPTRVSLYSSVNSSPATVRFSLDRSTSPNRSISAQPVRRSSAPGPKKTCMCSPTNHPGSFRCSLHKNCGSPRQQSAAPYQSNRLFARRSAMTNSLVRIGTVEGDLVKRALAALIRPSSHHQRRRADFQSRPSRLSVMSKAEDLM